MQRGQQTSPDGSLTPESVTDEANALFGGIDRVCSLNKKSRR